MFIISFCSFQTCLSDTAVFLAFFFQEPLSPLPPQPCLSQFLCSHHPMPPSSVMPPQGPQSSHLLTSISTALPSPGSSVSPLPPTARVPLSLLSLLTSLQTLHHRSHFSKELGHLLPLSPAPAFLPYHPTRLWL